MSQPTKSVTEPDKVYERTLVKTILRIAGFLILLLLNISLIGSDMIQLRAHQRLNWQLEGMTFLAVLFFDVSILIPILFEVRKVKLWHDHLVLNTLFWQANLKWKEIIGVKEPLFFSIAVLKTKRCSYIINKADFPQFSELIEKLKGKLV